jgi:hypothetical protein
MMNREEKRAYAAAYYAAHRDEILAKQADYYAAHRDEMHAKWKALRAAHIDERRIKEAAYRDAHRDEIRDRDAIYRQKTNIESLLYIGNPPHHKRCPRCRNYKKLDEYHKGKGKYGIHPICKVCVSVRDKKYKGPIDRFWKHYYAKTERVGDCIEWRGWFYSGMPHVKWEGKAQSLRRVIWRLAIGELADNQYIVTTCRNQYCVRQSHMMRISQEEFRSSYAHKYPAMGDTSPARLHPESRPRGDMHPHAKLKESDIPRIFTLKSEGIAQQDIAQQFTVSESAISCVLRRATWAHVPID